MPKKLDQITIDEVINTRKDFANDDGVIFKAHVTKTSWNKDERSAVFVMSAETVDRHRDVVVQSGIELEHFNKNPIGLFNHRSWDTPIGLWSDLKIVNGKLKRMEGKHTFVDKGIDDTADKVARHVEVGTLRACSIGFKPKKVERIMDDEDHWTHGFKFILTELFEGSVCTIPAVREALVKGAGNIKEILSPEVVEEFLEHLKSNPAVAALVDKSMFEFAEREATGNKTITTVTIDTSAINETFLKAIGEYTDRIEKVAEKISSNDVEIKTDLDPVAKELEDGVSAVVEKAQTDIETIDDENRKSKLLKIVDSVKSLFAPVEEEVKLATDEQKTALKEKLKELEIDNVS